MGDKNYRQEKRQDKIWGIGEVMKGNRVSDFNY